MKKEPSDKLVCFQFHGLLSVAVCIVPPEEGNIAVMDVEDTVITDGDPVGISAEVLKDPFGAIKGRFAIDDPFFIIEMASERFEGSGFLEMADTAGEYKITRFKAVLEEVKELASEQRRHDPYGNEEAFAAWHPAFPFRRQTAAGDNTVDVGMIHEVLSPGVQNAYDTCPRAEMLGII
jgi:hypothetical protein